MAVVTGDRYLDLLARFVEANCEGLVDGGMVLKLNPVGLYYVQTRLDQLEELEALRAGAPVDYLRAYIADLGDHRALEQLRHILSLLTAVKVVSMLPSPARDPSPVTLLPFARLRSLELRGCDLSTSSARGLLELRPILEKLICQNSADALKHIFAGRTAEIQGAQSWTRLSTVSCSGNGMLLMDESLQLLPVVESLDLSRNRFAKIANMHKSLKLKFLDVGFNHIRSVVNLHQNLMCVTKLILRNNAIVSVRGLERIATLEALDLSHNLISNFREMEVLDKLPCLHSLWLVGNPITFAHHYRKEALSFFHDPRKLVLDGRRTGRREFWAIRQVVVGRQKQRSKYGAFTPAETPHVSTPSYATDSGSLSDNSIASVNNSLAAKQKKKYSRLASIEDVSELLLSRVCDDSRQGRMDVEVNFGDDHERANNLQETVSDLIQQAEALKREGASSWLKELNKLLDKKSRDEAASNSQVEQVGEAEQPSSPWQRKKRKKNVKRSMSASSSGGGNFPFISQLGELYDLQENSVTRLQEGSASSSRHLNHDSSAEPYASWDIDKNYLDDSDDRPRISSVDGNQSHLVVSDRDEHLVNNLAKTLRLTEELSGSTFTDSSVPPPQFNQDLLHRRQDLERELLQLPLEPESTPFSDSGTSSDDTYSQLSDSSDSVQFSPRPFVRSFGCRVGKFEDSEQRGKEVAAPMSPRIGDESLAKTGVPDGIQQGIDPEENSNHNMAAEQTVPTFPPKPPLRRIIRLEIVSSESNQTRETAEPHGKSPSIHRRSSSLGVKSRDVPELTRSLSSSIEYSSSSNPVGSEVVDGELWVMSSETERRCVSAPQLASTVGELERLDSSSPKLLRFHSLVGPVVEPCA